MSKITAYAELTAPADDDLIEVVDISDTSMAATGTNKRMQSQNLVAKKLKTTTGPTVLAVGAVADGEILKRSGATIIGAAVGGGGVGDVVGPSASVDSEIALFDNTTGKLLKRATTTGLLKAASGVIAAATAGTDYVHPVGATIDETGGPLTLDSSHNGKIVLVDDDVTVPSGLGAGFNVMLIQIGAGPVAIIEGGTTVNNRQGHASIAGEFGTVTLYAYVANTFILSGDTDT